MKYCWSQLFWKTVEIAILLIFRPLQICNDQLPCMVIRAINVFIEKNMEPSVCIDQTIDRNQSSYFVVAN